MASEKLSVILELITGQYKKEAREAATATTGISNAAKNMRTNIQGAVDPVNRLRGVTQALSGAFATLGIAKLVGEFRDMAKAAAEDAESQTILANALRTNVGATDEMVEANERWITSMQIATRTADTDLRQAITDLTVSGRSLEDAQKDIAIAIDIAASKGINLDSVIKGLVRSLGSGSTAGLSRLGIATRDAAGEMLTYEEVLQNAAETMGGTATRAAATLAGALERGKIAMEEAAEEAGTNFLPTLVVLTDAWNELKTAVLGGNTEMAKALSIFNTLITQGIDPFENKIASAATVLSALARSLDEVGQADDNQLQDIGLTELTEDATVSIATLELLVTMLDLTKQDVIELRGAILQLGGEAFGLTNEQAAELVTRLDEYIGVADPAVLATRRFQQAQKDAAGATRDHTGALQAQRDLLREMTDPLFALLNANERYEDAQRTLNEALVEGGTRSDEYQDALSDLLRAQIDLTQAQADANAVGDEGLDLLRQYAIQAGINMDAFDQWAISVGNLAGAISKLPSSIGTVNTITGNPNQPGAFHTGGVVPGPRGSDQLILAQGGEGIIPLSHMNGNRTTINRGGATINVASPSNNLPQDLQYAALLANHATFGKF